MPLYFITVAMDTYIWTHTRTFALSCTCYSNLPCFLPLPIPFWVHIQPNCPDPVGARLTPAKMENSIIYIKITIRFLCCCFFFSLVYNCVPPVYSNHFCCLLISQHGEGCIAPKFYSQVTCLRTMAHSHVGHMCLVNHCPWPFPCRPCIVCLGNNGPSIPVCAGDAPMSTDSSL